MQSLGITILWSRIKFHHVYLVKIGGATITDFYTTMYSCKSLKVFYKSTFVLILFRFHKNVSQMFN